MIVMTIMHDSLKGGDSKQEREIGPVAAKVAVLMNPCSGPLCMLI